MLPGEFFVASPCSARGICFNTGFPPKMSLLLQQLILAGFCTATLLQKFLALAHWPDAFVGIQLQWIIKGNQAKGPLGSTDWVHFCQFVDSIHLDAGCLSLTCIGQCTSLGNRESVAATHKEIPPVLALCISGFFRASIAETKALHFMAKIVFYTKGGGK